MDGNYVLHLNRSGLSHTTHPKVCYGQAVFTLRFKRKNVL